MRLTINLATRGRPEHLAWTLETTLANIKNPHTMLMVSLDEDDEVSIAMVRTRFMDRVWVEVQPREDSVGAKFNRALKTEADVYLPMVDYVAHVTPGFDEKILEAASLFPDGIGIVYNHMANLSFPGIQGVTAGLAKKLGYIYPEHFPYWFIDHWMDDIGRYIGRISFADVLVATRHEKRKTHEFREPAFWASFYDAGVLKRRAEALRIIDSADFLEPEWRKEILRRQFPLIESRSQWINDQVRGMDFPPGYNRASGGTRYELLRAKAEEMMRTEFIPSMTEALRAAA